MYKLFTINVDKIPIGFFREEKDRDLAFEEYIVPNSDNCVKGEMKGGI